MLRVADYALRVAKNVWKFYFLFFCQKMQNANSWKAGEGLYKTGVEKGGIGGGLRGLLLSISVRRTPFQMLLSNQLRASGSLSSRTSSEGAWLKKPLKTA